MIETTSLPLFNRKSVISFIVALLAFLALCVGLLPVPFTLLLCYPPGILLGISALILGIQAQREIRQRNEGGKWLAVIAVWFGTLTLIGTACIITGSVLLYPYISDFIQQNWHRINPQAWTITKINLF